jgi:hypothetical protein
MSDDLVDMELDNPPILPLRKYDNLYIYCYDDEDCYIKATDFKPFPELGGGFSTTKFITCVTRKELTVIRDHINKQLEE